jgi:hypothetical protein
MPKDTSLMKVDGSRIWILNMEIDGVFMAQIYRKPKIIQENFSKLLEKK